MSDEEEEKNKKQEEKNNKFLPNVKPFYKKSVDLEYVQYECKIDEEGIEESVGAKIPVYFLNIKPKISNRKAKLGVEVGNSTASGGLFAQYDFRKKEVGIGAEISACKVASADVLATYNYEEDIIKLKGGLDLCYQGPGMHVDLFDIEIKDVAHNTIGKVLDATYDITNNFVSHVSPQMRELAGFNNELREQAMNVKNIGDLNDVIKKVGDYEMAKNSISSSYQIHCAEFNYLNNLDDRVSTNAHNIEVNKRRLDINEKILDQQGKMIDIHSEILANHEHRLNVHDKILAHHTHILANHEKRLNQHEKILGVHTAILNNHEKRLNQHERILNAHENRLNQHESILRIHSDILAKHEETLNLHEKAINNLYSVFDHQGKIINLQGKKINELDNRMINVENNLDIMNKQVNIHSQILSQHSEILNNQGECINELYNIANDQQIQLNKHSQLINEHQNAIVQLYNNFHGLKGRIENDEKVINELGHNLTKVIKFSVDTDSIVNGLIDQSQINKDLIVQNYNDLVEVKKDLKNQADFILMHHQHLKDISKSLDLNWKIIEIQEKDINEIKQFAQTLSDEIKIIYEQIDELKNKLSDVEKNFDTVLIAKRIKKIKKDRVHIKERMDELIENIDDFDEKQKSDFIKCMYIAINNGTYNLEHLEKVAENILNYN